MVRKPFSANPQNDSQPMNYSGGNETNIATQQAANDLDQIKRSSYFTVTSSVPTRDEIYKWLSPPDPSTNHSIACDTHYKKTAAWFLEDRIYHEWKSKGSLLWVHGKRSSCSSSHLIPSNSVL
jgi:hypothetical protein